MHLSKQELGRRKYAIIHCAFEQFCQKGINYVTMEEIAKDAGVGVASLYRYFNTKAELVLKTQEILWHEVLLKITSDIHLSGYESQHGYGQICLLLDGFENLYKYHSSYLLFAADYKVYLARENLQMKDCDYNYMLRPVYTLFCGALKKGITDGSLTIRGDIDDIFFTVWSLLRGFVEDMIIYGKIINGENPWTSRFYYIRAIILHLLNTEQKEESLKIKN